MDKKFDIVRLDCEERFGIASAGFTSVNKFSSLVLGVLFSAIFYGILSLLRMRWSNQVLIEMFFPGGAGCRSIIPIITILAGMWCLAMLMIKRSKISVQKKAFSELATLCKNSTVDEKLDFLQKNFESVGDFAAAYIIKQDIEHIKNGISEADRCALIDSSIADLEKASDTSFIPASTLIWAVPVLGFIGTVLGLARAVGNFGVLASSGSKVDFEAILPQVTGGLATAFETTLIALVTALILQIFSSFCRQSEERFFASLKTLVVPTEK